MTAFFSTAFINALSATPGMINGTVVKCVLFREAPAFDQNDARYIGKTTIAQLLSMPGWIPVLPGGAPLSNTITVGVRDEGKSNYVMFSSFPFTGLAPNEAKAAVFLRPDDTIIFGTNTPFNGEMRVVKDGDSITSSPDSTLVGASNRWLYSWADAPQAGGTIVTISEGPLLLSLGPPDFEPAHTQHVWLYPQRANMIANPSFEKSSPPTAYWSSNGSITRVPLVNPPISAGRFAGRFQYGGVVVAESNTFPTMREEYWTIQFMARGLGDCKVGFVWWDDDFEEAAVDWGDETWRLDPDTFIHISVCRFPVQTYQGMLRIEASGGDLTIDQVLCEAGFLKDWPYFDGDTDYGMREDFTWYGGEVRQGGTYSLWYNHKRAVFGRMFARQIADDELVTDEVMAAQGISYSWVPAGTNVTPHMDVLYPHDLQLPVPDKPAGVLSYQTSEEDLQGIVFPWGLFVHSSLHAHEAEHLTLQVFLQVQSAAHAHTAANATIVAVPNTPIIPADAVLAVTSDNITLTQIFVVQPDSSSHGHTAEGEIIVVEAIPLVVQDAFHAHIAQQPAHHYLNTAVGYASTPSIAIPAGDITWVFAVLGPAAADSGVLRYLAGQWGSSQNSWNIARVFTSGNTYANVTDVGTGTSGKSAPSDTVGLFDQTLAVSYPPPPATQITPWTYATGTWVAQAKGGTSTCKVFFASTNPIQIGRSSTSDTAGNLWLDRIYWIEMRTGNSPTGGTVLWRFDASEHVSGTSWTDARGKVWTLTSAAAVVHVTHGNLVLSQQTPITLVVQNASHAFAVQADTVAWLGVEAVSTNSASTPDPGPMPQDGFVFVFKTRGPRSMINTLFSPVAQNRTTPNRSFELWRLGISGGVNLQVWADGTTGVDVINQQTLATSPKPPITEWWAVAYNATTGAWRLLYSTDNGVSYTQTDSGTATPTAVFDSTSPVTIGASGTGNSYMWDDDIYWVELRTGDNPLAGALLWKFDANDHVSGTSWADPRGNTWTVGSASAVVHPVRTEGIVLTTP